MPTLIFLPENQQYEVDADTKILAAAVRNKVNIRFGCGALRCGTCGVKVDSADGCLSPLKDDEKQMLEKLKLPVDGSVRMACRTRVVSGTIKIDLDFQPTYSPGE
jgi:ferredoxin